MEEQILNSIRLRPGISNNSDELLREFITDTIQDIKDFINYSDTEELPSGCISVVKELAIIKCNRQGTEGITGTSYSGVSENYLNDIPKYIKKKLYRYRRLF